MSFVNYYYDFTKKKTMNIMKNVNFL